MTPAVMFTTETEATVSTLQPKNLPRLTRKHEVGVHALAPAGLSLVQDPNHGVGGSQDRDGQQGKEEIGYQAEGTYQDGARL